MNMLAYYAFYTSFKTVAVVCTLYTPDTVFRTVNRIFCDFFFAFTKYISLVVEEGTFDHGF